MSGGDGIGADDGVEAAAKINVRVVNGGPLNLLVKLNSTVEEFRKEITENCAIRDDRLLLIYKDRIMAGGLTLQSYGVEDGETVDAVEFRDAHTVIGNATQQLQRGEDIDFVENLEKLDLSAVENLVNDPEFLRNLNMNNTRMIAICDRNITVLSQVNDRMTTLRNSAAAGSSHASTSADHPPLPQIALNPPLRSVLLSNQLVRDILQKSETARLMASRGQTSREASAQNDGGTISAEERYASQLAQLKKLKFNDIERNIRALNATEGDLIAAVHVLIGLGDTIL